MVGSICDFTTIVYDQSDRGYREFEGQLCVSFGAISLILCDALVNIVLDLGFLAGKG